MQNRYTADIGDFGKYGMLRRLCIDNTKLGVNWYLVPDESNNEDGRFVQYLDDSKSYNLKCFQSCDSELYKYMQSIITNKRRSVYEVQRIGVLPPNTVFYDTVLSYEGISDKDKRKALRNRWAQNGLQKLKNCDIVFFDPDNGLEVPSYSDTSIKGTKFVFYYELADYFRGGQSLIIYNHRDRKPENEYLLRLERLRNHIDNSGRMLFLRFNRFSVRDYIFVLQKAHVDQIHKRIQNMMNSNWSQCFKLYSLE